MKRILILMAVLEFGSGTAFSQYVVGGEDPSSIKWRQIETRYHKLVYDERFEEQAKKIAAYFDYSAELVGDTSYIPRKKLPVLIHNHSVIPNGSVTWIPRRMELYTVPPQDLYPQGWYEQLAIHEGRHVAQIYKLHQFETLFFTILLGEQGAAPAIAQTPPWFFEGDAVVHETALTKSGRGRQPSFEMGYRAFLLENENYYSFRKAVFGSLKDYVPNHYELGYLMVAYNRSKYGKQLWDFALQQNGHKIIFTPFLGAIKEVTGLNRQNLYKQTFNFYKNYWRSQADSLQYTDIQIINKEAKKSYTSYSSPIIDNGKIYTIKNSIDDVTRIVSIDLKTGKEEKLFTPGYILSDRIQMQNGIIVWDEYQSDIRWSERSYAVIRTLDVKTGKSNYLTQKTRYNAPSISPDGTKIAVTESKIDGNNHLNIISAQNGEKLFSFATPQNAAIQTPTWNEDSKKIVMTMVGDSGKNIVEFDLAENNWKNITKPSFENINTPVYNSKYIYFQTAYSGIDNVYAIDTLKNQIFQVSSVKNGAFQPFLTAKGDSIFISNYSSKGFDIALQRNDTSRWISKSDIKPLFDPIVGKIAEQEPKKFDKSQIKQGNYISKSYNKFSHFINIHSWVPFYIYNNPNGPTRSLAMPGLILLSQNLHSTLIASGGAGIHQGRLYSNLDLTYKGLFPVFAASILYGDSINYINNKDSVAPTGRLFQFDGKMSLPFDFSQGNKTISFEPTVYYRYENRYYQTRNQHLSNQGLNKLGVSGLFRAYINTSRKDITPRAGIRLFYNYNTPVKNDYFSASTMYMANLYLPGIFKHHSIKLSYEKEFHNLKYYFNASMLGAIRGFYGEIDYELATLKEMQVYSAEYFMPLFYPDITLLKVIYLKRVRSSLFFDYAQLNHYYNKTFVNKNFNSKGVEILTDFNLFFIPVDLSLGVRISQISLGNQFIPEFIVGMIAF